MYRKNTNPKTPDVLKEYKPKIPNVLKEYTQNRLGRYLNPKSELDTDMVGAAGENFELLEYRKHFYKVKSIENSVRMMKLS